MSDSSPLLLLIETSGRVGRVGLAEGPSLVAERSLDESRRHARDLAPAVADILGERGRRPRDLGGVVVSLGPGSYTGLRVGVMSAKAMAYAVACPAVGVPTFVAIARQAEVAGDSVEVVADAQQGKLYVQMFTRPTAGGILLSSQELRVVPGRAWATARIPGVAVCGPGLRVAKSWLSEDTPITPESQWDPRLTSLLLVGWERWVRRDCDPVHSLEPLYHRPSSAEEQWRRLGR
jgi:tRNA threonylcarbamoyladenosine biosynthesis protein TsaB